MAIFGLIFWLNCGFQPINYKRDATISFKLYRRVKHHKIQAKFDKVRGHLQIFDLIMTLSDLG